MSKFSKINFASPTPLTKVELEAFYSAALVNFQGDEFWCRDWEAIIENMVRGDSLFVTGALSKYDQICDTKEHADIFFRCYKSPEEFERSSYCIEGIDDLIYQDDRWRYRDNWILIQEKLNEIAKKFYKKSWGKQVVPDLKFEDLDLVYEKLTPVIKLKGINTLEQCNKFAKNRSVYLNGVLIGHARSVSSSYLPVGLTQHYDDEDMRYFYHDIDVSAIKISLYESVVDNWKTLPEEIKKRIFCKFCNGKQQEDRYVPRAFKVAMYSSKGDNSDGLYVKDMKQISILEDKIEILGSREEPKTCKMEYERYRKPERRGRIFTSC